MPIMTTLSAVGTWLAPVALDYCGSKAADAIKSRLLLPENGDLAAELGDCLRTSLRGLVDDCTRGRNRKSRSALAQLRKTVDRALSPKAKDTLAGIDSRYMAPLEVLNQTALVCASRTLAICEHDEALAEAERSVFKWLNEIAISLSPDELSEDLRLDLEHGLYGQLPGVDAWKDRFLKCILFKLSHDERFQRVLQGHAILTMESRTRFLDDPEGSGFESYVETNGSYERLEFKPLGLNLIESADEPDARLRTKTNFRLHCTLDKAGIGFLLQEQDGAWYLNSLPPDRRALIDRRLIPIREGCNVMPRPPYSLSAGSTEGRSRVVFIVVPTIYTELKCLLSGDAKLDRARLTTLRKCLESCSPPAEVLVATLEVEPPEVAEDDD